jgi:hypothetical protein
MQLGACKDFNQKVEKGKENTLQKDRIINGREEQR